MLPLAVARSINHFAIEETVIENKVARRSAEGSADDASPRVSLVPRLEWPTGGWSAAWTAAAVAEGDKVSRHSAQIAAE